MLITTWNINSIRLRISLLQKLITEYNPDVICLQETKVRDEFFPLDEINKLGFSHVKFAGEKSYNGVAIISKLPITDSFSLSFHNDDKRHIAAKIGDLEVHNFYIPAGGDIPDPNLNNKFFHKLEYIRLGKEWFTKNRSTNDKIIIAGDLNIAPFEHDVWSSKQLANVVSHTGIERKLLLEFLDSLSFIDSARYFTKMDQKFYTWWSYRNLDWQKSNRGRRLDHIWASKNLEPQLKEIFIASEARGWPSPSDHVPYMLRMQ